MGSEDRCKHDLPEEEVAHKPCIRSILQPPLGATSSKLGSTTNAGQDACIFLVTSCLYLVLTLYLVKGAIWGRLLATRDPLMEPAWPAAASEGAALLIGTAEEVLCPTNKGAGAAMAQLEWTLTWEGHQGKVCGRVAFAFSHSSVTAMQLI